MTQYIPQPNPKSLVKLSGTMRNVEVERIKANFFLTEVEEGRGKTTTGIIAILGTLAGSGGAAMTAATHSGGNAEDADYVTFELDGKQIKGWLKYFPFKDGDAVHIAAEEKDNHWIAYAVAKPDVRTIALYPNCKRSKSKHIKAIFNVWLLWVVGGGLLFTFVMAGFSLKEIFLHINIYGPGLAIVMTFFGIYAISYAMSEMPFVRLAEKIFQTLGFPDPANVDLKKSSKKLRTEEDENIYWENRMECGDDYFKY